MLAHDFFLNGKCFSENITSLPCGFNKRRDGFTVQVTYLRNCQTSSGIFKPTQRVRDLKGGFSKQIRPENQETTENTSITEALKSSTANISNVRAKNSTTLPEFAVYPVHERLKNSLATKSQL